MPDFKPAAPKVKRVPAPVGLRDGWVTALTSAGDLTARGRSASTHTPFDFTRAHGRGPLPEPDDALEGNRWVFAHGLRQ